MSEQTIACPICGNPYKVYMFYSADQSACPGCVSKAKSIAEHPMPDQRAAIDRFLKWAKENQITVSERDALVKRGRDEMLRKQKDNFYVTPEVGEWWWVKHPESLALERRKITDITFATVQFEHPRLFVREMIKKTLGVKHIASLPEGETTVAMVIHQGTVFVASNKSVYRLSEKNQLEPILFSFEDQGEAAEYSPRPDAPRGTDEDPCWCNGPWPTDEQHHGFCRTRRKAWSEFLDALSEEVA